LVVITLLFLVPLIGLMPHATLGALVLVTATGLAKLGEFGKIVGCVALGLLGHQ
jgi:MFS superfamily sulfate permease-like transporter